METVPFILNSKTVSEFLDFPSFIPPNIPLITLPKPFDFYIEILDNIHLVNTQSKGGVRQFVDLNLRTFKCNISLIDNLSGNQKEKLLSVLTMIAHCYRWNYLPPCEEEYRKQNMVFPSMLWEPLKYVANCLDHPYCGTLWSTTVSNFQLIGKSPDTQINLENTGINDIVIAHSWVENNLLNQLQQWVRVFIMTEIVGSYANKACFKIMKAVQEGNIANIEGGLEDLLIGIKKITSVFNQEIRGQKLDIHLWRNYIQPTFIWGIISEGSEFPLEGASGLQVGCVHLIDLTLGIAMDSKMGKAMMESRKYFSKKHRELFAHLESNRFQLKNYISNRNIYSLTLKYNSCIHALEAYRVSHKQRGKLYIKGDGTSKSITTTGLSVNYSNEAANHFEKDMQDRIEETRQASSTVDS